MRSTSGIEQAYGVPPANQGRTKAIRIAPENAKGGVAVGTPPLEGRCGRAMRGCVGPAETAPLGPDISLGGPDSSPDGRQSRTARMSTLAPATPATAFKLVGFQRSAVSDGMV